MEHPLAAAGKNQQRSVACQTDSQELDEATVRNELAMGAYLEILGVLDDDRQPVYHDLGEAYANKVFLQAMADGDQPMEEDEEPVGPAPAAVMAEREGATSQLCGGGDAQLQRLRSLESEVIDAEWSLRCKLAQVREVAKHPVQRWLEGALPITASASPFASRAPSVRSGGTHHHPYQHHLQHQRHLSATASHCSRPSSVAGLSEVFVSDSDDDEDNNEEDDRGETSAGIAASGSTTADTPVGSKSEITFYSCAVHGFEVPESFVRIKVRGVRDGDSDSLSQQEVVE